MKLGVLDYGAGNLRSVLNAFATIGHPAKLVAGPADFDDIDTLVFPGQGAFGDSVRIIKQNQLWDPLKAWLADERPYIGICLGYQLLFASSEESPGVEGLGVAPGRVRKFAPDSGLKIPHMGWNQAEWTPRAAALHEGIPASSYVYFVHSYYPEVEDENLIACATDYGTSFASGIIKPNLVAVQFHPEKSQETGLRLLKNAVGLFS
ncbi:MAG: imidazole glycerol phosphate synthase, glutamine amidotransferase subunit [Verrucomicrobiaceae bacterium]|nr:imidazole glycerol phosphate synthase, glutamine amidotransferase subunit [Verrucomicrobiaceae bacterium]MDB6120415.1 imidazole glycerol phosphate synthase, glutamine amidotransferase subunit [Verrucomicrobiaceae bacterium]